MVKALAWLGVAIIGFLFLGLVLCIIHSAHAKPPPGTDLNSPLHKWFDSQHNVLGNWCCRLSDGHMLEDDQWRTNGKQYEVEIDGKWQEVPPDAVRDPNGGYNPTGKAVVWYNDYNLNGQLQHTILCFAEGTLM